MTARTAMTIAAVLLIAICACWLFVGATAGQTS